MIDVDLMLEEAEKQKAMHFVMAAGFTNSEIIFMLTRLREAEKDAARYRWLRDNVCMFYVSAEGCCNKEAYLTVTGYGNDDSSAVVDAAIDEQMKEKGDE